MTVLLPRSKHCFVWMLMDDSRRLSTLAAEESQGLSRRAQIVPAHFRISPLLLSQPTRPTLLQPHDFSVESLR